MSTCPSFHSTMPLGFRMRKSINMKFSWGVLRRNLARRLAEKSKSLAPSLVIRSVDCSVILTVSFSNGNRLKGFFSRYCLSVFILEFKFLRGSNPLLMYLIYVLRSSNSSRAGSNSALGNSLSIWLMASSPPARCSR